MKDRY